MSSSTVSVQAPGEVLGAAGPICFLSASVKKEYIKLYQRRSDYTSFRRRGFERKKRRGRRERRRGGEEGIRRHFFFTAGKRKRNKGIDRFLNWSMKATCVAFGHDSNP
ncbi:MAG: hypothetical protein IKD61_09765, partial [Oscillospiraceae bacterium]|nr:hypothetical protein [Oscillospiraceae bacterium]